MTKKISLILILVLFLFQAVMTADAEQPDKKALNKIEKLLKKGTEKVKEQEFEKAFEYYNKALEISKEYAPIYVAIARLYNIQKKFDDSLANLEKAVGIQPDFAPALDMLTQSLLGLGKEMTKQRQLEKSNAYYTRLTNIPGIENSAKPKLQDALFELGLNYSRMNNAVNSNEFFLKLLAFEGLQAANEKKYIIASYQVGANFFNLKKYPEAEKYMAGLIAIEGLKEKNLQVYTLAHYLMGVTENTLNKPAESTKYFLEYLTVTQNNPSDRFRPIVNYMVGANNYDLLQKELSALKDEKKNMDKKVAELAKTKTGIQPYLAKAIELDPKLEPAYSTLGNYYFMCRDYEKAVQIYETLIGKFVSSPDIATYKKFLENIKKAAKAKK